MDYEYETRVMAFDENLQAEIKKMEAAGWQVNPSAQSLVIMHVQRPQPQQAAGFGGFGSLGIDESKVHIMRDGKIVDG
jgi:hypothetical protein